MTMISDLPEDLLREIVCRIPLKSMRAVRFTCKSWDTLSKSGIFCNEAAREAGESRMVAIMDYNLHLISVVADADHPSIDSKGKLTCLSLDDSYQQIIKVFHCDGLMLCVLKYTFRLLVWNPYLGQTRWIEPPSFSYRDRDEIDTYKYALGYDYEKKSHKILRFMDGSRLGHLGGHLLCYDIYDFDSNLWRTLDVGTPHWYIRFYHIGVSLNGNAYWLANHRNSYYNGSVFLICFDFTSETFGPPLSLPFPSEEGDYVKGLLSCIKGEKLSLLLQFTQSLKLEIWVRDPKNVLWSKLFKVDSGPDPKIHFSSSSFFIDEEKKVAVVFDKFRDTRHTLKIIGEAGFCSQVDVDPLIEHVPSKVEFEHAHVCSYVPSLVQVQIKKRVFKRRQRSKLEIRPCPHNKSRILDHEEEEEVKKRVFKRKLNHVILDDDD